MKVTRYLLSMQERPDRAIIKMEWIQRVIENPVQETVQEDGHIRRRASIEEYGGPSLIKHGRLTSSNREQ
jgi:hypothetical protein